MWVVIYYQYGRWSVAAPFESEQDANKHADRYLRGAGNEHKEFVELRFIELPDKSPKPSSRVT